MAAAAPLPIPVAKPAKSAVREKLDAAPNLAMAWVLTLPASIVLSGFLFWTFRSISS